MKRFLSGVAAAGLALAMGTASAQSQRPIRVLVASAPAGPSDVQARLLQTRMSEALGRTLIVDNRASNNGVYASELCAKAAADGNTICVGNSGTHAVNATLYQKLPYDVIRDFAPVSEVATTGMVVAGESHISLLTPLATMNHIASGRIKPYGITSAQRHPLLPQVPTVAEQGVQGYDFQYWNGIFAPKKIPDRTLRELHKAVMFAIAAPEVKERFGALGLVIVGNTPEEFASVVKADVEKFRKAIVESGIPRL